MPQVEKHNHREQSHVNWSYLLAKIWLKSRNLVTSPLTHKSFRGHSGETLESVSEAKMFQIFDLQKFKITIICSLNWKLVNYQSYRHEPMKRC